MYNASYYLIRLVFKKSHLCYYFIIKNLNADEALKKLLERNGRYVADQSIHPDQDSKRRKEILHAQNPFAVVIDCSDSHVPLEIIFDQGRGNLFVIRVAGNTVGNVYTGSLEYAVEQGFN